MKNIIKKLLIPVTLITLHNLHAQQNVGIMTKNPQSQLHVSGTSSITNVNIGTTGIPLVTPTARINGLSSANTSGIFTGIDTITPLYVDSNGDTQVKKGLETFSYTAPGDDAITTTTTLNITANQTYQSTGNLLSVSFTLSQRSMVYISSTLTAEVQNSSGGAISDGKSRAITALLWFTAAPAASGIPTTTSYMSDGFSFSSRSTNSVYSSLKMSPSCEIILPAGNYTLVLRGAGIAANNSPDDNYRIVWGGGTGDKLNVLAKPL